MPKVYLLSAQSPNLNKCMEQIVFGRINSGAGGGSMIIKIMYFSYFYAGDEWM